MKKLIIFILNLFNRLFVKKAQIKHEQTQTASKKNKSYRSQQKNKTQYVPHNIQDAGKNRT